MRSSDPIHLYDDPIYIYLDTNIYLSFFRFSDDDLEELEKLVVLMENNKIIVLLPEQTENEYFRNREALVSRAIKELEAINPLANIPNPARGYDEFKELQDIGKSYNNLLKKLIKNIKQDQRKYKLKADLLIQKIFKLSKKIVMTNEIYNRAYKRVNLGNPPGKKNSICDAVNWESLLSISDTIDKLYFISNDSDYASAFSKEEMNPFLIREFIKRNKDLIFFNRLNNFLKTNFPDIKIATEARIDFLISNLVNSHTYSRTHSILSELRKYNDLSNEQLNLIFKAAVSNNQIYWIKDDVGVFDYLNPLFHNNISRIDPALAIMFTKIYLNKVIVQNDEYVPDDLPF